MPELTVEDALKQAMAHVQGGRPDIARGMCARILSQFPDHPPTLRLMGLIANQAGNLGEGEAWILRAIALNPTEPMYYHDLTTALLGQRKLDDAERACLRMISLDSNSALGWNDLGNVMMYRGDLARAEGCYRKATELSADYMGAFANLGTALNQMNRLEESLEAFRKADSIRPNQPGILLNMGGLLSRLGRVDEAIEAFRRGMASGPSGGWAHCNLGSLLLGKGQVKEALAEFDQAIAISPDLVEGHNNRGLVLQQLGRVKEAIEAYLKAVELSPDSALIRSNLGNAYLRDGRIDEATRCFEKGMEIDPKYSLNYYNLGTALKESGLMRESLAAYEKAMELNPGDALAHSNLLYLLHFVPEMDLSSIRAEHEKWNRAHAVKCRDSRRRSWLCDRNSNRPLRVGFVSPDFRLHPVGRFVKPLIRSLDKSKIQAVCYSDLLNPDDITLEIQRFAAEWRAVAGMTDEALADLIVRDRIDILVDLTMHMAGNRMSMFAMKPAPVQVSWLAYCSTTGLETMDYRISDPHMDPEGWWEKHYTEKTARLPRTYWCYEAPAEGIEPGPLPAMSGGRFTFGCLNNISKINDGALDAWSRAMKRAEGSRLILHARAGKARSILTERLERRGIDRSRVEFADMLPLREYLEIHRRIDLALDPFPYNGGTTTCDALWMGIPVVTLAGDRPMGRAGVSLLTNLGLESWIAKDAEEYENIAAGAAGRLGELADLRKGLRGRMLSSPLMDAPGFAGDFADLMRSIWNQGPERGG